MISLKRNLFSRILQRTIDDEDRVNQTLRSLQEDDPPDLSHESRALSHALQLLDDRLEVGRVLHLGPLQSETLSFLGAYCVLLTSPGLPDELNAASLARLFDKLRQLGPYDLVLLWDLPNYMDKSAVEALIELLHDLLAPGSVVLMAIHSRSPYPEQPALYRIQSTERLVVIPQGALGRTQSFNTADFLKRCTPAFESRSFQLRSGVQEIVLCRQ